MADSYSRWVMTDAFANNSQAAINAGQKIEWVSIKTSDDSHIFNDLSGFNDTTLATATIRQTTNISSVTITGKTVTITGLFDSNNNTADYYIRTMFLVARYNGKEFLAGATVANSSSTAFRMPAASGTEITEFTARPQISVSNTSTISATVNPVASATNERVDGLEADTQAKIDYLTGEKDMLWDRFKDFVTKATAETINGAKTFTQTIVGSITGNAGTATKLQTARKLGGQSFDGTSDVNLPGVNVTGNQDTTGKAASADVLNIRIAKFTDISVVTADMITYAGNWLVNSLTVSGIPSMGYVIMEVLPVTGNKTAGIIRLSSTEYLRNYIGTVKYGSKLSWVSLPDDSNVVHNTGNEDIAGTKKFTGNAIFNNLIDGYTKTSVAPSTDLNLITKPGKYMVNNSFTNTPKGLPNSAILSVETNTADTIRFQFIISRDPNDWNNNVAIFLRSQVDYVWSPWRQFARDEYVVHSTGAETIRGAKAFTDRAVFNTAISGKFESKTLPDGADLYTLIENNVSYICPTEIKSATIVNKPSEVGTAFGVLAINTGGYTPGTYAATNLLLFEYGTGKMFTATLTANETGVVSVIKSWTKIATDDSLLLHNSGNETANGVKTFTQTIVGSITGNAGTATKLQTARRIAGVSFDGTTDVNLPGVNIAGNQNTSGNAASATKLQTPRLVGGVSFDGTKDIVLPGVNAKGNQDTSGRAANADLANKAVALNTPRKINGTNFDGTADINVNAANDANLVHKSGAEVVGGDKEFTGTTTLANVTSKNVIKKSMTLNNIILDFAETASGVVVYVHSNGRSFLMDSVWHDAGTLPAGITPPQTIVIADSTEPAGIVGITTRMGFNIKISISPTGKIGYKLSSLLQGDTTARTADVSFDAYTSWFK